MATSYFKPNNEEEVANLLCKVAEKVPDFPVYYYHIPMMNGVDVNVEECLTIANARCPNVVGCKYTG